MKQFAKLAEFCLKNDIAYSEETDRKFYDYYSLLVEKNKVMNLTAVTEQEDVEIKHFIDSLEAVPVISSLSENDRPYRIVDIGTGAGFPGIPLAIVLKDAAVTLVDSLNKRIGFLKEVISALDLKNASAIQSRAEDFGQSEYRETFDICVSRAVANATVLLEYMLPLVREGGYCILYKSGDYEAELAEAEYAIETLGGSLAEIRSFDLPGQDMHRSLILIKKTSSTPSKYPRKAGKPSKSPLKK